MGYKKIRVVLAWLLIILCMFSLVGCDFSDFETPDGEVLIEDKSVKLIEPERKSILYSSLDEVGEKIYNAAYTALCMDATSFTLIDVDLDVYQSAYAHTLTAFINDHPEFFWLDGYVEISTEKMSNSEIGNMKVTLGVFDYWSQNDLVKAKSELKDALAEILLGINSLSNDYEKVKFAHDYIIEFNSYDYGAYEAGDALDPQTDAYVNSAYGALVGGKVMCAGYARAFDLLMHSIGVESLYVSGLTQIGSHAWNLVCLDENFYHIDLTWDDLDGDPAEVRYNYFCLTDEEITKTHKISSKLTYPEATASDYNYFVKEGMVIDYYSFARVKKLADKYEGEGIFAFKCHDKKVMSAAIEDLIENNMIFSIEIFGGAGSFQYMADEDNNILTFYVD